MGSERGGRPWAFPLLALALAGWAVLPPYVGPSLTAAGRAEVADHVVPGVVVALAALSALALRMRPDVAFGCALLTSLSGLWMTATHLPLVRQAANGGPTWVAVVHHTLPGVVVLLGGAGWALQTGFAQSLGPGEQHVGDRLDGQDRP